MKVVSKKGSLKAGMIVWVLIALSGAVFFHSGRKASAEVLTTKTWNGGGVTNNWSEAANWSGGTVPAAGDDVVFDATSTKNATIDVDINVGSIFIASGYTGTITQLNAASVQTNGCSGRPCYRQDGGTFAGSTNTITLNSSGFGGIEMSGGVFNGGSGDMLLAGASSTNPGLSLSGGVFTSTSGNLTTAGSIHVGGTFEHNGGTVTLTADDQSQVVTSGFNPPIAFNNLNVDLADGASLLIGRLIVEGDLALNDGSLSQNGSTMEARGGLTISPNFDGGNITLELGPAGVPRTFTFATGLNYPKIVLNDPNLTVNTSGSGTLVLPHQLEIRNGTFNQGNVDLSITPLNIGGDA